MEHQILLKEGVKKEEAEEMVKKLREAGATAELKIILFCNIIRATYMVHIAIQKKRELEKTLVNYQK